MAEALLDDRDIIFSRPQDMGEDLAQILFYLDEMRPSVDGFFRGILHSMPMQPLDRQTEDFYPTTTYASLRLMVEQALALYGLLPRQMNYVQNHQQKTQTFAIKAHIRFFDGYLMTYSII